MLRLLPTDALCEIVSLVSTDFACDYYPTDKIFLYPIDPIKHYYGYDPITREPTLLFKTIYVTVKADNLPIGVGFQMRMLPDVRKVVFYTDKKPRDVVTEDFPIHILQKRMDPHWDLKTVDDISDLPTQYVEYQYPDWRVTKIRLATPEDTAQLTTMVHFFDKSVRYPIKLVLIAPEPEPAAYQAYYFDVDIAMLNILKKYSVGNFIYQIQLYDGDPGPFRSVFKATLDKVNIPDVEGRRLGFCHRVKQYLVSPATKKRALATSQRQRRRKQPKPETYRQTMTFADAPEWIVISWRLLRNRPDINILWNTFYADWLTEGQDIADTNEFNKKVKDLGRVHQLSLSIMTLWTRYLRTKRTVVHIMEDEIGNLLRNAFIYEMENENYIHAQTELAKWSQKEQWVSKPVVALIVYIPGHAATLAYFRSTNRWVYYDTSRLMYFDFISDIVYLLNQYVNPSDPDPVLCTLIDSPGQKREIFWVRYGECTLHSAGRLELLSQGIFDPMARVDTEAVRQKLLSIVGIYGGFLARYVEKLLEASNVPPGKVGRLWRRHEADVRELYKVNPATRQNIKRLYYMHSFEYTFICSIRTLDSRN